MKLNECWIDRRIKHIGDEYKILDIEDGLIKVSLYDERRKIWRSLDGWHSPELFTCSYVDLFPNQQPL